MLARRWRTKYRAGGFAQVKVLPSKGAAPSSPPEAVEAVPVETPGARSLSLMSPKGWRVEGLTFQEAAELLARLS